MLTTYNYRLLPKRPISWRTASASYDVKVQNVFYTSWLTFNNVLRFNRSVNGLRLQAIRHEYLFCSVLISSEAETKKLFVMCIYFVMCSFLARLRVTTLMGSWIIAKVWVFRWGDCFHEPSLNPFIKVPQNWTRHLLVSDQRGLTIVCAAACTVQRLKRPPNDGD